MNQLNNSLNKLKKVIDTNRLKIYTNRKWKNFLKKQWIILSQFKQNIIRRNIMPITSEVDKVNGRLKDLFELDESFVIALNGEWGIGKTHFWNKFVEHCFSILSGCFYIQ